MKYLLKILKYKKTLFFLLFIIFFIIYHYEQLPKKLFNDKFSKVVFAKDGELLNAKIAKDFQWRFPEIKKVPKKYKDTLLIFEDKRFESHFGVDLFALSRALYLNIKNLKKVSGASTISMQVIRLSRKIKDRGYSEKIKEMILAIQLERRYSKEQILALYASYAPYGGNIIGLNTASWRYFLRPADRLSWAETALLVILPNSPSMLHLGRNRKILKRKRDGLLLRLKENKKITNAQYKLALLEPLPKKIKPLPKLTPNFLERLIKENKDLSFFNSTIDYSIQKKLLNIINQKGKELFIKNIDSLAAVIIDNKNLNLVAYVGNSIYSDSNFLDMTTRGRSSGSILKPFLYSAMLENSDITPKMLIEDIPTFYSGYTPINYSREYSGVVPIDEALARSLNIPAVRMLHIYGINKFYDFLEELGITTLFRKAENYGLTLILGGAEVTLWDLSGAYANLSYILNKKDIKYYSKIKYLKNRVETEDFNRRKVNLSRGAVYLMMSALLNVKRPSLSGYWRDFILSQKISWKTGTSYGFRDAWAIGMTPKYTVAIWVGNADGEGVADLVGGKIAAPILFSIFNFLDRSKWFEKPNNSLKSIDVCKDDGFLATNLCDSKKIEIPINSYFDKISPYHYLIHLDKYGKYRVNSSCEKISNMTHKSYFVLPPIEEYYYKHKHFEYKKLPDLREDCKNQESSDKISIVYPSRKSEIYIPRNLDGKMGSVIFKVVHKDKNSTLFWHIDNKYFGKTKYFHEKEFTLSFGEHSLTVIDTDGNFKTRKFIILSK